MSQGIGPKGTSLLNKLGLQAISQLSNDELRELVSNDRIRRVLTRATGRIKRIAKDRSAAIARAPQTLETIGLAPALIIKLRASGKPDGELIAMLKERGVI